MSNDSTQHGEAQDGGSSDDLSAALTESDATFVTGEKKQQLSTGTLLVGGLLFACAAATYFMYVRTGPKAAAANPETASASATITQFLSDDTRNAERMRQLLSDTEKAVQQFQTHPARTQVPIDALRTNPFRQEKADLGETAAKALEQKKRDQMLKDVAALKVQSIIHGKRKAVMINNTLYEQGQVVEGFTVDSIGPAAVVMRKEANRFELKMQK